MLPVFTMRRILQNISVPLKSSQQLQGNGTEILLIVFFRSIHALIAEKPTLSVSRLTMYAA